MANATSSSLKIAPLDGHHSVATPHLMPFHIGYSGPAPISTYFRITPIPEPTFGEEDRPPPRARLSVDVQQSTDSQATLVEAPTAIIGSSSSVATLVTDPHIAVGDNTEQLPHTETSHYSASFRGREMHGTKVMLPEGYAGIVLRSPEDVKGKGVAPVAKRQDEEKKSKTKGRSTRRSKRAQEVIEVQDDEEAMDVSGSQDVATEEEPTRTLEPTSTFSSFVLWTPDNPVDAGRDEYLRSLKEWTRLAAEIHKVED
ncbi:ribonuclease H2, subunit C [Daedaleopsis nitida]|nr:ribonuclease H2, subunit C [Daedaleopsis nitida]